MGFNLYQAYRDLKGQFGGSSGGGEPSDGQRYYDGRYDQQEAAGNRYEQDFDEFGYLRQLPRQEYALTAQLRADAHAARRNQMLAEQAGGILSEGLGNLQTYRDGGTYALSSGFYGAMANNRLGMRREAPDLLGRYREHQAAEARRRARRAAREAGVMSFLGPLTNAGQAAAAAAPTANPEGGEDPNRRPNNTPINTASTPDTGGTSSPAQGGPQGGPGGSPAQISIPGGGGNAGPGGGAGMGGLPGGGERGVASGFTGGGPMGGAGAGGMISGPGGAPVGSAAQGFDVAGAIGAGGGAGAAGGAGAGAGVAAAVPALGAVISAAEMASSQLADTAMTSGWEAAAAASVTTRGPNGFYDASLSAWEDMSIDMQMNHLQSLQVQPSYDRHDWVDWSSR